MKEKQVYAIALLLLIGVAIFTPMFYKLGTMVAGPEGVDAHVYGIQWTPSGTPNEIKTTANAVPKDEIGTTPYPDDPEYYYSTRWQRPDPYNPDITFGIYAKPQDIEYTVSELKYGVRIRQAQVHEVNIHGDPLGTRNPTEIVWYSWDTKTVETEDQVEWKRHEAFIVPVDFVFEISCRASKDGSWGPIQDLHYWLVLDTVRWYNAFAEPYAQIESNDPPPEGAELKAYNYRGAFPIWAWVEEWDPFVIQNDVGDVYDVNDLPDELDQYLEISPSVGGSRLPLYNEPNWQYIDMFASDIVKDDNTLMSTLANEYIGNFPDPRFAETVYTPITLSNYGALKQWGGWWVTYWEKYYYPTSYIRVRALYAIWGEWIYLWTKQEADDQGYQWQNKTSIIIEHDSAWDQFWGGVAEGLGGLLSNPLFWLASGLLGTFIMIALLIVFAGPALIGFLGWLFGRRARGKNG